MSPMPERCCLWMSACVSFAQAAEDVARLTGMKVSMKTQHRLQQHQEFVEPEVAVESPACEAAIDGGNVRLIVASGQEPKWRRYKAVHLALCDVRMACFDDNDKLIKWLNAQPMLGEVTCLGDGHDGV